MDFPQKVAFWFREISQNFREIQVGEIIIPFGQILPIKRTPRPEKKITAKDHLQNANQERESKAFNIWGSKCSTLGVV